LPTNRVNSTERWSEIVTVFRALSIISL
jgi:hypothetical protein